MNDLRRKFSKDVDQTRFEILHQIMTVHKMLDIKELIEDFVPDLVPSFDRTICELNHMIHFIEGMLPKPCSCGSTYFKEETITQITGFSYPAPHGQADLKDAHLKYTCVKCGEEFVRTGEKHEETH